MADPAPAACICTQPGGGLARDKQQREFALAVRHAVDQLTRQYAYQRERGLVALLRLLRSATPDQAALLRGSAPGTAARIPNVARTILRTIFTTWSDAGRPLPQQHRTVQEKTLGLQVLEGCALLLPGTGADFADGGVQVVLQEFFAFTADPAPRQDGAEEAEALLCTCVDALLAGCVRGPHAQQHFLEMDGPALMLRAVASPAASPHLRQSIVDGLAFLAHVIALSPGQTSTAQRAARYRDALDKALGPELAGRLCAAGLVAAEDLGPAPDGRPPADTDRAALYPAVYRAACLAAAPAPAPSPAPNGHTP